MQHHADRLQRVGDADLTGRVGAQVAQAGERLAQVRSGERAAEVLAGLVGVDLLDLVLELRPGMQPGVVAGLRGAGGPDAVGNAGRVELVGRGGRHEDVEMTVPRAHALAHTGEELVTAKGLVRHDEATTHEHHLRTHDTWSIVPLAAEREPAAGQAPAAAQSGVPGNLVRICAMMIKSLAKQADAALLWTRVGSRVRWGQPPPPPPSAPPENAVLQDRAEWEAAVRQLRQLRLPVHRDLPKNWDTLAALSAILARTERSGSVLDAGAALYSTMLPVLWRYGYQRLTGVNLEFRRPARRGPARFLPGDLTATGFESEAFDAITCLSVVEHGVDLTAYLKEASRLLRPGGILYTSTDFSCEPIDTRGMTAYGQPVHIFTPEEITAVLDTASGLGLRPTGDIDLRCSESPVTWKRLGLRYTFVGFTLRKQAA